MELSCNLTLVRLGAMGEETTITVKDGRLQDKDYVIRFPVPMSKAWDNVIYTCSGLLLFRNEVEVDE
ncbi:Alkylmercury lyase [Fusarium austroafricanum]|uniref:Alkylmercury lyase n=1 Tax=Fusarium austroafricanum TaxID=2364996 RepID=A0A8H4KDJ4_9HYPO|nr:Alkylmercury lyase [Fusarium austroafricanum]